ncbi:hypothetical protein BDN72DRAFT_780189 [Pluteus cervinus]|uniref:Uncharacterized protein n=1 Tax=Pluteus cervinus TaxID=181527 RepID=A0ACD3A4S7_9AGAR|nr:hypothetical protein BDN72DRAFT_780189 [Pluteus cervinus]
MPNVTTRVRRVFKTLFNSFSIQRTYHGLPSSIPDENVVLNELLSDSLLEQKKPRKRKKVVSQPRGDHRTISEVISPYPNLSTFFINLWFWKRSQKAKKDRRDLVDLLLHPEFKTSDLVGVNFDQLDSEVGQGEVRGALPPDQRGWKVSTVRIRIPTGQKVTKAVKRKGRGRISGTNATRTRTQRLTRGHRTFRCLTKLIRDACSVDASKSFHWHPFEEHWRPPWTDSLERVYGELYTSPAFLRADQDLADLPTEPGCGLPRAIVALIFYSDATHVAQFGQAKLWPIYVYFGNQSKYERGRRSARAAYNLAFLPDLPDSATDFIRANSVNPTAPLLTHSERELYQACWKVILDEDFLYAYEHGLVITCGDQIQRRLYPRIFMYCADYPEKILIATMRNMAICPCPRCTIPKTSFWKFGQESDMNDRVTLKRIDDDDHREAVSDARELIYEKGYVITSEHVDNLLKDKSFTPTENAFSHPRLRQKGLDVYDLMVVDLMHELELGVWKDLLRHLIRMLHTQGSATIHEFNSRFRAISPFGPSTIRKFNTNVSDLRKLAARDYEDILQCCIPCFEGLLPFPHNETILDLLYLMGYFHSLAKLRMHTDSSIRVLRRVTTVLSDSLRYFASETCQAFQTVETEKEYDARRRKAPTKNQKPGKSSSSICPSADGRRAKSYSLATSKMHAIVDYADQIVRFGTTDSLSTKPGESNHRLIKELNNRTNKNNTIPQIVKIDNIVACHSQMKTNVDAWLVAKDGEAKPEEEPESSSPPPVELLASSYNIAAVHNKNRIYLPNLLRDHSGDPAFKDFLPRLKAHLLADHQKLPFTGESAVFSEQELFQVRIQHNMIYSHATAGFNYTTYDIRREQDKIHVTKRLDGTSVYISERCDVMLHADEDGKANEEPHPYWYARVLGIYHAQVFFPGVSRPKRVDFLYVRWFGRDMEWNGGPRALRLDRLGFVPANDPDAFGFISPSVVIRACHLVPAFALGRTTRLLGNSWARDDNGDWENYYVMRFVDRDMMMRHLGLGAGHCYPAGFPREDEELRQVPSGPSYVETKTDFFLQLTPVRAQGNVQLTQAPLEDEEEPEPESELESEDGQGEEEEVDQDLVYEL